MVNVLEHIADDAGTLRGLSRLLVPNGNLVVYVPALNGLYGALDEKIGHYRRYSVWRMREVFREAGIEPVELRWVNFLAIPAWAAFSRGDIETASAAARCGRCGIAPRCQPRACSRRTCGCRSG